MFWKRIFRAFREPHYSWSRNSEIFQLWSSSFFSKCSKFDVYLKNGIKIAENVFGFWHNFVQTSCGKISLMRWEYMWSPVKLLKHRPNISDLNKTDVSVLDISHIKAKHEQNFRPAHFSSVLHPWTRWLQKGVLKQDSSSIQETTFFPVKNFRNILAMKLIFFCKVCKILCRF